MSGASRLRCRACGADAPVEGPAVAQVCADCFGPVAFDHGWADRRGTITRSGFDAGAGSMWRFGSLLPVPVPDDPPAAGATPLAAAPALGDAVGVPDLWLKDETANPSGSFKDRVVSSALAFARSQGMRVAACASTGNLARSLALLAPRFGMSAVVLVPEALDVERVDALRELGAQVVRATGPYDAANRLSVEAAMDGAFADWAWVNVTLRPWYVEGAATIGYEVAQQLGWRAPDHLVTPAASGSMACQTFDALHALDALGLLDGSVSTRLSVTQPAGCAPIASAFAAGSTDVAPVKPDTVAPSVAMGDPPEGPDVLTRARSSGGAVVAVPEGAIPSGVAQVAAHTEITVEPAGGVVIAGLGLLVEAGVITRDQRVVAVLTGGLPVLGGVGDPGPPAVTMQPTLSALREALAHLGTPKLDKESPP